MFRRAAIWPKIPTFGVRWLNKGQQKVLKSAPKGKEIAHNTQPEWQKRDLKHRQRYGAWNPTRKLSRTQMEDLRSLRKQMPHMKTIDFANLFKVLPEAIRRILQSKWDPSPQDEAKLEERAQKAKERGKQRFKEQLQMLQQMDGRLQSKSSVILANRNSTPPKRSRRNNKRQQSHQHTSQPYMPSVGDVID